MMADRMGQQLGNYRLIHFLGQGGFADVYIGEHIYLKTQSALKVLRIQLANDALQDFLKEAQTIARLEHPHIVRVLEYGVEGHTPFLVMNYAPNGTLRQRHRRGSRLSPEEVLRYVQQIASALDYAHQEKLIHRDIKPENILLGRANEVQLSDFGLVVLAQSTGSQTTKEMAGTVPYMAPEQLQGRPRLASDQYALGIVVYEWLSGACPFQGSFAEVASQHLLTPPPPLCGRIPGITPDVEQVVFRALAKDWQQRFATVQEFATALEQACQVTQQDPVSSYAESIPQDKSLQSTHLAQRSHFTPIITPPTRSSQSPQAVSSQNQSRSPSLSMTPSMAVETSSQSESMNTPLPGISLQPTHTTDQQRQPSQPIGLVSLPHTLRPLKKAIFRRAVMAALVGLIVVGGMLATGIAYLESQHRFSSTPTPQPTSPPVPTPTPQLTSSPALTPTPRSQSGTLETLTVPFTSDTGTQTVHSYSGIVTVTVSGAGGVSPNGISDAFYMYTYFSGKPLNTPQHAKCWVMDINGLPSEKLGVPTPRYNTSHWYQFTMKAPGGPLRFSICDNNRSDNHGALTVTIKQN